MHLMGYKHYVKKIEKTIEKMITKIEKKEDNEQLLVRNDKTSCCFIF